MELNSKLDNAIGLAWRVHYGQTDKQGEPYILHVMRVVERVRELGWKGDYLVTAVLHDVLEDGTPPPSVDELKGLFGSRVAAAVVALTKRDNESYEDYIGRVVKNQIALRVKLEDIEDHLSRDDAEQFFKYKKYLEAKERLLGVLRGNHVERDHATV